jgi:hypothetical protein
MSMKILQFSSELLLLYHLFHSFLDAMGDCQTEHQGELS